MSESLERLFSVVDAADEGPRPEQALEDRTVKELRAAASALGWRLSGTRRDDILRQLVEHYADPDAAAEALDRLTPLERRGLALMAWIGEEAPGAAIERLEDLSASLPAAWVVATPDDGIIADWLERGYLLPWPPVGVAHWVAVPTSFERLLLPIPELVAPPADAARLEPEAGLAFDPVGALLAAGVALCTAGDWPDVPPFGTDVRMRDPDHWVVDRDASAWRAPGGSLTWLPIPPACGPFPEPLRDLVADAIGARPSTRDAGAPGFFMALLAHLGPIVRAPRAGERRLEAEALAAFADLDSGVQLSRSVAGWRAMAYPTWDELSCLQAAGVPLQAMRSSEDWSFDPARFGFALRAMRRRILGVLRWLPLDRSAPHCGWVDYAALTAIATQAYPDATGDAMGMESWCLANARTGPIDTRTHAGWRSGPGIVWRYVFQGPLTWLGLVETVSDAQGEPVAIRLTDNGVAYIRAQQLGPTGSVRARWHVDDRVTIWPEAGSAGAIAELLRTAAAVGADRSGVTFRLTAARAARAFGAGRVPGDIVQAFERLGLELPAGATARLDGWWAAWGRVHRYDGLALVEVDDPSLMRELVATTCLDRSVICHLSPTVCAIEPGSVAALVAELRRRGHTPRILDSGAARRRVASTNQDAP